MRKNNSDIINWGILASVQKSSEGYRIVSSSAKLAKSEDATGGFADDDDHDHFNDDDDEDDDDDDGGGGDNLLQSWRKVKMQPGT